MVASSSVFILLALRFVNTEGRKNLGELRLGLVRRSDSKDTDREVEGILYLIPDKITRKVRVAFTLLALRFVDVQRRKDLVDRTVTPRFSHEKGFESHGS